MLTWMRATTTALAVGLVATTGCMGSVLEDEPGVDSIVGASIQALNGLVTVNGLRTRNGLISSNGLTTTNGLRSRNGLTTVNGLRTRNGWRTRNGLEIDCTGRTLGLNCSGDPDGLLSAETGLMSSDDGIATASYVTRCALAANDSISVKAYTGELVDLPGELGLAPEWKDGDCTSACQEKVSACLMAFTNGKGENVDLEMSAAFVLGTGHSSAFKYQEAAFYGNLFVSPPQAYYCVGKDYALSGSRIKLLETRSCQGYNDRDGECPYVMAGYCNDEFSLSPSDNTVRGDEKCTWTGTGRDTARSCEGVSSYRWIPAKTYNYPITTFRNQQE